MKNQLKKSLSLFLAVLMLLSCWVWVAPQKAEAGTATQYYVKIVSNVTDTGNENSSQLIINYKDTNGKGDSGRKVVDFGQMSWDGNSTIFSGPIDGWPVSFTWTWNIGAGRAEKHENITFYVGGTEDTCTTQLWKDTYNFKNALVGTDYLNLSATLSTSYNPEFKEITDLSTTDVAVNKLPNGADVTSSIKVTGGKDQYGVNWAATIPTLSGVSYKLKYTNSAGTETDLTSTNGSISGTSNTATATFKDDVQTLFPNSANAKIYVHATYNSKTKSVPINLTFPTYDITFDANGGKIGASDSDGKDQVVVSGIKYGGIIGKSPVHRAKAGFEFKEFYSEKNADANGLNASFSGTKYVDSETLVGTQGDMTYYAAWQALPITATFLTADNQLIGTVEGRYNNFLTAENMYNGDAGLNVEVKASHTAGKVQFNDENEPVYTDGNQAYTFAGWKIIEAYDESVIDGNEDTVLKGDVTFKAVYTKADATKYTVSFEDGKGNVTSSKKDYLYRDQVTGVPSSATKTQDDRYSYEFIGWAKKLEGVNYFAVDANDCDKDGIKLAYTSKDAAEFIVKGNATYVPVFRMTAREYNVTFKYTVDGGATETVTVGGYLWDDTIVMPEGIKDNYTAGGYRYYIDGWKVGTDTKKQQLEDIKVNGDIVLTATYGAGQAAEYTINFYGKAEDGVTDVLLNKGIYTHNSPVTAPEVPKIIDTQDSLYTFKEWSPEVKTTATADAEYRAIYTKKDYADIYFYNYDGTLIYSLDGKENGFFKGDVIPEYSNIVGGENVLPSKEEDPTGTYKFTGWADAIVNGNEVIPGTDRFEGDTHLYAQFETTFKEYTVKFLNDDGSVISEKKYHYEDEIEVPENPEKEADETFSYDFKAWTPDVSEVCYSDATYTATYRREYNKYQVTWLNDKKEEYKTSNYRYEAKIQQAVLGEIEGNPDGYEDPAEGNKWVFNYWVQCDENGNDILVDGKQVIFTRGQTTMGTEHLYFYPVFKQEANLIEVTFYKEDGETEIKTVLVKYGDSLSEYVEDFKEDAHKVSDEDYHYTLTKWVNLNGGADVETVTEKISVKPSYTPTEHTKDVYDIIKYPTCTETGLADVSCSADECDKAWKNVTLDVIADINAPAGQINVGSTIWESKNPVDFDDVKYISPSTFLVVNGWDFGTRSQNNPEGTLSRGVGKIEYFISEEVINDTTTITPTDWTTVYDYEAVKQDVLNAVLSSKGITLREYAGYASDSNTRDKKAAIDAEVADILAGYKANATGIASNLNLEDGKEYIIYIRISDREVNGESNKVVFSSGKLAYGTKAPEITVSGKGYGTKFCTEANIRVSDDANSLKVYLDGDEVETYTNPGTTSANGTFVATFKTEDEGLHTVTVIDKHGNKTTKVFEINGTHTNRYYKIAETCDNEGASYNFCIYCGEKSAEVIIPAKGHSFAMNYTETKPGCLTNGSRTYVCDNNCGKKLVATLVGDDVVYDAEGLVAKKWVDAAEGEEEGEWVALTADDLEHLKTKGVHTYEKVKDENGKDTDEDAWVIDKAATCKEPGSKHRDCIECGVNGTETVTIPVDTENGHKFYRAKTPDGGAPTCTEIGKKTQTCRYCGFEKTVEYTDALGHVEGEMVVVVEAQCEVAGSKVLTCATCGGYIAKADKNGKIDPEAEPYFEEIPALGHAYKAVGNPVQDDNGDWYQNYVCANDATHTKSEKAEGYKPPVPATVTFDYNGGIVVVTPAVGVEGEEGYIPEITSTQFTIATSVNDTLSIAQAGKTPVKAKDETYTYTFSHWATRTGNGSVEDPYVYTAVEFPVTITGDVTFYAVYAEKYVNYTITYYTETVNAEGGSELKEYKKQGYLHNGGEYELAEAPAMARTWEYDYKFIGWKVVGSDPEIIYNEKLTIDSANVNLVAKYEPVKRTYAVTFAYTMNNIIDTILVEAGEGAVYSGTTPTKAYTNNAHYKFIGWDRVDDLKKVMNNIYTTAEFKEVEHTYNHEGGVVIKTPADCTKNAVVTYTCTCGYTYDYEMVDSKLGHDWVYTNGKYVCQRENCGEDADDIGKSYTIIYYNANEKIYTRSTGVNYGVVLGTLLPEKAPEKASDKDKTYSFAGWSTEAPPAEGEDTRGTIKADELIVNSDLKLYPVYTSATRQYKVIFAYNAGQLIGEFTVNASANVYEDDNYAAIEVPTKASDSKYHYTFAGWNKSSELRKVYSDIYTTPNFTHEEHTYTISIDKAATCTTDRIDMYECTGCDYSYPKTVLGTATGHKWGAAVENDGKLERPCENGCGSTTTDGITYSITYYTESGDIYTREYNLVHGSTPALAKGPEKAADRYNTYTFAYWATKSTDENGKDVYTEFSGAINSDLELYPVYTEAARKYTVTFLNANGDDILKVIEVEAGNEAVYPADAPVPTKMYDNKYHYTFNGKWDSPELDEVYNDITAKPEFTAAEHEVTGSVTTEATCQIKEVKTFTCACEYSYTVEGSYGTHDWGEPVTADGVTTTSCKNDGCEEKLVDTAIYKVKYFADKDATEPVATKTVEHGTKFADISVATPTKAEDVENTYAFSHWYRKGDAEEKAIAADVTVTGDIEVVAKFNATARMYTVVFGYNASTTPLQTVYNVKHSEIANTKYTGETTPSKGYDSTYHYVFSGFKFAKTDATGSVYFYYAQFDAVKHTLEIDTSKTTEATCTQGASYVKYCTAEGCTYTMTTSPGKPAPHTEILDEDKSYPAENGKDGLNVYYCSVCKQEVRKETIKWQNPEANKVVIKITVKDSNNNLVEGAKVDIYSGSNYIATGYTGVNGIVEFTLEKGEYRAIVGIKNASSVEFTFKADKDGEVNNVPSLSIRSCGCACHHTGLWGKIFRFFHKIIKSLTGEFKCCSDPSELYN